MKLLRSLFALCALALSVATASASYVDLEREYLSTPQAGLENSYHVFGYEEYGLYSLTVDYFFATKDLDGVVFEAWVEDENGDPVAFEDTYGGPIEAGEDFSFLDLEIDGWGGHTLYVAVTFDFSDNTQLTEVLSSPIN